MVIAKQIANSTATSNQHPIRSSYQNKGTWGTAKQIVRNCGVVGLYAGFQLQMGKKLLPIAQVFYLTECSSP